MTLEVVANPEALAQRAAEIILKHALFVTAYQSRFSMACSGGSTPKRLYELLSDPAREFRSQLPWAQMHFFWTDERHVGPEDPESNFHMSEEAMLRHVEVPAANIHRIRAEHGIGRSPHNVARISDVAQQPHRVVRNEDALIVRRIVIGDLRFGFQ